MNEQPSQSSLDQNSLIRWITEQIYQSSELKALLASATAEVRAFLNVDQVIAIWIHPQGHSEVIAEAIESQSIASVLGKKNVLSDIPLSGYTTVQPLTQKIELPSIVSEVVQPMILGRQSAWVTAIPSVRDNQLDNCQVGGLLAAYQSDACPIPATALAEAQGIVDRAWLAIAEAALLNQARKQVSAEVAIWQAQAQALELQRSLELANALKQVTTQIRSSLGFKTVLQTIAREVRQLLDTDRVVMYGLRAKWVGEIVVESTTAPWNSLLDKDYQDNCFTEESIQHYQEGQVRSISNVADSNLSPCHKEFLKTMQVQANLVVPIRMSEQLWGLLIAHECRAPRIWQPFEIELLQQLADQAAIAIQQAELYEQSCEAAHTARIHADTAEQTASELNQTLRSLQQAQMELIQTAKLSSLGHLVAGVAHEINNPVTFIYGNLCHATTYTQDLLWLIAAYRKQCPEPDAETQAALKAVDFEYLTADFPKLLSSMQNGANRIQEIVKSLRNFSRHDEAEKKVVDLHEGIDSTLLILQHRLKANGEKLEIQVIKAYGDLPLVECYAGQLNQVFMNLISNAIDALEPCCENPALVQKNCSHQIKIRTSVQTDCEISHIVIEISDNGVGMTETVREKLFEPFFTTKPVGKGTGLGLSISYQIVVEKHKGTLQCTSQPGQGSTFWIEIPIESVDHRSA